MKFFPESALVQLEYDKIKGLLKEQCDSEFGKSRAEDLRIHTKKEFIDHELKQSDEFKQLLEASRPVMKWLNENCHPHMEVRIEHNTVQLFESQGSERTDEYLRG